MYAVEVMFNMHDTPIGTFCGVYTTLDKAITRSKEILQKLNKGETVYNCQIKQCLINDKIKEELICIVYPNGTVTEDHSWKEPKLDYTTRFAYDLLNNDPIACDAVRDILKM